MDFRQGRTNYPARSATLGRKMQQSMSHQTNYRFNNVMAIHSGHPDVTLNPSTGTFYIPLSAPEKADQSNRNIAIAHMGWPTDWRGGAVKIEWTAPGAAAVDVYDTGVNVGVNLSSAVGDRLFLDNVHAHYYDTGGLPLTWDADGSNEFRLGQVDITRYQVAALTMWEVPHFQLTDTQEEIGAESVGEGQPIRGYASSADSFGGIVHKVGDGVWSEETVERAGRRVLANWMHPKGVWTNETSYKNLFGTDGAGTSLDTTFAVNPRRLLNSSGNPTLKLLPAVVLTNTHADAYIKLTNTTTSNTWVWQSGGANTGSMFTYGHGTPNTGLEVAADAYTEILVEARVANSSEDLTVHSIFMFEGAPW